MYGCGKLLSILLRSNSKLSEFLDGNRAIAQLVVVSINKYGDITNLAYSEEYGRMYNLLQEFDALTVESQKVITIDLWVVELHRHYDEYMAAVAAQSKEGVTRTVGARTQKCKDADVAFYTLVLRVNALAVYSEFIDDVNFYIDREHKNLAARKSSPAAPSIEEGSTDTTPPDTV